MTVASARRRLVAALLAGLVIALAPSVETSAEPSRPHVHSVDMSTLLTSD